MTSARPGTGCPRWCRFLDEITGGDSVFRDYLRRLAGYCLSGSTREQVFVFLHGHGANGKSVFLQAIAGVLKTYAATATLDTFMAGRSPTSTMFRAARPMATMLARPTCPASSTKSQSRVCSNSGREKKNAVPQRHGPPSTQGRRWTWPA